MIGWVLMSEDALITPRIFTHFTEAYELAVRLGKEADLDIRIREVGLVKDKCYHTNYGVVENAWD
jgi:hypothetical protein